MSFVDLHLALPGLRGHRVHVAAADDEPKLRAALTDCLRDLRDRENTRIALLWLDADASLDADLQAFLDATRVLDGVGSELAEDDELGKAHQLEVFLLGAGSGFGASA